MIGKLDVVSIHLVISLKSKYFSSNGDGLRKLVHKLVEEL